MEASDLRPIEAEYSHDQTAEQSYFREKPDRSNDPAGEAGWFLQRERERFGLTLEEVSEATGIHPYHLEAIEFGDLTHMPNRADALNMVGFYAHYLGFDPEPLIHHYAIILPKQEATGDTVHPANPGPLSSALILKFGSFPKLPKFNFNLDAYPGGAGGAAASFLVAIMVFAGVSWVMLDAGTGPPAVPVALVEPPQSPAAVEQTMAEAQQPTALPAVPETSPQPEQLTGLEALIAENVPEAKNSTGLKTETPDATAAISPVAPGNADSSTVAPADTSRVTLKARGPVWVRIEDSAGLVVMTQMLMAGDTYQVPNREGLVVIARDGGLLSFLIDGKEKGILGPPGEILVGRSLDIKALEQPG